MYRFFRMAAVAMAGLALIVGGFVYDLLFAGLPYQDPTPELLATWAFHKSVADWIISTGITVFLLGTLLYFVLAIRARHRSPEETRGN